MQNKQYTALTARLHSQSLSSDCRTHRARRSCGILLHQPTPFIYWAWHLWYGIFLFASLGYLPGCAPSQLLHTCSLAKHGKLKKGPWFLSNS